jgi:hypothetical protein
MQKGYQNLVTLVSKAEESGFTLMGVLIISMYYLKEVEETWKLLLSPHMKYLQSLPYPTDQPEQVNNTARTVRTAYCEQLLGPVQTMTRAQGTKGSISIKECAEAATYKPNVLQCI